MKYVAGFYFDKEEKNIALVEKNRPAWQKGKLNAIGGKIENGESPAEALTREFLEETGVKVDDWEHTVSLAGNSWEVHFFRAYGNPDLCKTVEDEKILVYSVKDALNSTSLVPNIYWILPMSLEKDVKFPVKIEYS